MPNTENPLPIGEKSLPCAPSCPFKHLCAKQVGRRNKMCMGQISASLNELDPSFDVKKDGSIDVYALTGDGNVPVGTVKEGKFKTNEVPRVLPSGTI